MIFRYTRHSQRCRKPSERGSSSLSLASFPWWWCPRCPPSAIKLSSLRASTWVSHHWGCTAAAAGLQLFHSGFTLLCHALWAFVFPCCALCNGRVIVLFFIVFSSICVQQVVFWFVCFWHDTFVFKIWKVYIPTKCEPCFSPPGGHSMCIHCYHFTPTAKQGLQRP